MFPERADEILDFAEAKRVKFTHQVIHVLQVCCANHRSFLKLRNLFVT
jgi:hypothetical protein